MEGRVFVVISISCLNFCDMRMRVIAQVCSVAWLGCVCSSSPLFYTYSFALSSSWPNAAYALGKV